MEETVSNKKYFAAQINSSVAFRFTKYYHYSGQGFKKAQLNLGVFRNDDKRLVGVLQWGISASENIRLDRYVKDDISKSEYLELNRFCMDDDEGRNSESLAISLGIRWIRTFRKDIRLLVSYSGRKEGNYGYIYQATNWEYLGYFVSPGFWLVDGVEKHLITLQLLYRRHGKGYRSLRDYLCSVHRDVRQTWTKQFIYVMRLDSALTLASDVLPYPKPTTEFPIKVKEAVYREDPDAAAHPDTRSGLEAPKYVYEPCEMLFSKRTLVRRGEYSEPKFRYAAYDRDGALVTVADDLEKIAMDGFSLSGMRESVRKLGTYKWMRFRKFGDGEEVPERIGSLCIAEADGKRFYTASELAKHLGVSVQYVSKAQKAALPQIRQARVRWVFEKETALSEAETP